MYASFDSITGLQEQIDKLAERVEKLEKSAGEKFNYTIFPNPAPPNNTTFTTPINMAFCPTCFMWYTVGYSHTCPNGTAQPLITQAARNT